MSPGTFLAVVVASLSFTVCGVALGQEAGPLPLPKLESQAPSPTGLQLHLGQDTVLEDAVSPRVRLLVQLASASAKSHLPALRLNLPDFGFGERDRPVLTIDTESGWRRLSALRVIGVLSAMSAVSMAKSYDRWSQGGGGSKDWELQRELARTAVFYGP